MHEIHYTVDGERLTTKAHELTVDQILKAAGKDPLNHYLVLLKGHEQESFEGKPNHEIHMHDHMKFISISLAPTPVS